MRLDRIRIEAFGGLRHLDTGPGPLPDWVVVHGPNEAGKTTLFEFLLAMLYGFRPASGGASPWTPWEGGAVEGRLDLRLADGTSAEVHRRLASGPSGSLVRAATNQPLRNQALPWVGEVPRTVYRQVFAIALSELAGLDEDGWTAAQERLVGSLGARDLRSASAVVEELEREAGALWRPNQRGKQEIRRLDDRIGELAYRRPEARQEENRLRDAHAQLKEVRASLSTARAQREACRARLERARAVLPDLQRRERAAALEQRAGPLEELADLPLDPVTRLADLRTEAQDAAARLEQILGASARATQALSLSNEVDGVLVRRASEIEAAAMRLSDAEVDRRKAERLDQEIAELEQRLGETLAPLAGGVDTSEETLLAIPTSQVGLLLQDLARTEAAGHPDADHRAERILTPVLGTVAVAGALLTTLGFSRADAMLGIAGGLLLLAGLGGVVVRTLLGRRRSGGTGREPNSDAARVRDQLKALLGDSFSLPDEGVPLGWAQSLERAQASVRDRRDRERARAELLAGVAEAEGRARALIDSLFTGWDPGGDLTTALEEARTEAREAARRQEEARAARRELDRLEGEQVAAASTHEAAARKVRELEERVAALGEGDLARGVEAAATRLRARDLAAELRAELAQSGTELDPSEAPGSTDEVAQLSADEAALTETIEDLARRVRGLEKDLEHLQGRLTLGDLDGEVSALRAERDRLSRMRDRSWLLARLLAEADRRVREEHQPEVLREAGHSLTLLTGGRYDRLLVDEDGGGFHLAGPAAPRPIALASPLSTGTREQVYLALRLALLRPLEGRGESLPLSLDEVLVNWDSSRRARGLDLIAQTARQRQVFFFTCHESMASEAEERGAFRLDLPTPA